MDKLSDEVLMGIFQYLLPVRPETDSGFSETIAVPLCLSHVSRRWRWVSSHYRELWSYLAIVLDDKTAKKHQAIVGIFNTWIERTGRSLLNFSFWCDLSHRAARDAHAAGEYIITLLLSQQGRWRDVDFRWTNLQVSPAFPKIELNDLVNLNRLYLDTKLVYHYQWIYAHINLGKSSKLRDLCLNGRFILDFGGAQLFFLRRCNLELLRHYPGRTAEYVCKSLLRAATNLEVLEIRSSESFYIESTMFAPKAVFLRDIKELRLTAHRLSAFMIDAVRLPKLETLTYKDGDYPGSGEVLLRFMKRSRPPLTRLEIDSNGLDEDTLIPILDLLPTLAHLHLTGCWLSMRLFRALDTRIYNSVCCKDYTEIDVPAVCPRLTSLRLQRVDLFDSPDTCTHTMHHMIGSRLNDSLPYRKQIKINIGPDCTLRMPLSQYGLEEVKQAFRSRGDILITEFIPIDTVRQ